jgi:glyoxylase-like metal-dependent hydrolase (beta-lactamase superfamily II)
MAIESTVQIAPDIWRITLPLPFRLRAVHLYLVRGADGYSLIDAGLDTPTARAAFADALQQLGVQPSQITRLYVTHMHPDHIGMSGRHAQSGARAFIMPDEERRARYVWGNAPLEWAEYLQSHGMPDAAAAGATGAAADLRACVTLPPMFEYLADGDIVPVGDRSARVVWTPGHSDYHYMLVDDAAKLIFAGDHLLPTITPNIGLYPECRPDPLGDYLESLGSFGDEAKYRVLPAHGEPYDELPVRIGQLKAHHDERLAGVRERVVAGGSGGVTSFDVLRHFWGDKLSPHEVRFAIVEIAAHLEYLRLRGALSRESAGAVHRYNST